MDPLDLVRLTPLMSRSKGRRDVQVALIDGPVALDHPDLNQSRISVIPADVHGSCSRLESVACMHGTFVAGILVAQRESAAPAICPECTLLVRPIFSETAKPNGEMPSASPEELAEAIREVTAVGARVINLSAALLQPTSKGVRALQQALDFAAGRGAIIVAAAGNQASVGSSAITGHASVIPVIGCDQQGRPTSESNLGGSIGRRGLAAPGKSISSLGPDGKPRSFGGTSAAAPFVTGAIALLWSEFPAVNAAIMRTAVIQPGRRARALVPPVLDAWAAHEFLSRN